MAAPPYSLEDAEHYGTSMVKRNRGMRGLQRLSPGAHVVWLDQMLPMYRKEMFEQEAVIGMWKSINHRFRRITSFRRLPLSSSVVATALRRAKESATASRTA